MLRLLIAESSEIFANALADTFRKEFDIRVCTDGRTALDLLLDFQPDALILNLNLSQKDGITVLREAACLPPVILATCTLPTPYSQKAAVELGVKHILNTPTVNAVSVCLMDMLRQDAAQPDPQAVAALHLHILNFKPCHNGYAQLCTAIPLFAANPRQKLSIELYPTVAARLGSADGRNVERSIRKAICAAWKKKDKTVWAKYFPPGSNGRISCPSNKVFITCLAEKLNEER